MINWHDIQVEEKIAQERYQWLVEMKKVDQLKQSSPLRFQSILARLGHKLEVWGQNLQFRYNSDPCNS